MSNINVKLEGLKEVWIEARDRQRIKNVEQGKPRNEGIPDAYTVRPFIQETVVQLLKKGKPVSQALAVQLSRKDLKIIARELWEEQERKGGRKYTTEESIKLHYASPLEKFLWVAIPVCILFLIAYAI